MHECIYPEREGERGEGMCVCLSMSIAYIQYILPSKRHCPPLPPPMARALWLKCMFLAMSLTTGGDNESLDSFAMRENITVAEDDMSSSSHLQGFEQVSEGSLIGVMFVFG